MSPKPSAVSDSENALKRFWRRWFGPAPSPASPSEMIDPGEAEDRARLSFLLQQQEAELTKLKTILSDAQVSLKKAETERQKWSDTLNAREVHLEKERARATTSGKLLNDLDEELKKLRRDKLNQQRTYEDRIQDLLEKLSDLQKGYPPAALRPESFTPQEKNWLLEKQALQEELREAQDKTLLLEEKLDHERSERLQMEKQLTAVRGTLADLQEKLRDTEAALWEERTKLGDLEKEKAAQKAKLSELQNVIAETRRESHAQEPAAVSEEVILLRERILELESGGAAALNTELGQKLREQATEAQRTAERRAEELTEELGSLAISMDAERARWTGERNHLQTQWEEEKKRTEKEIKLRRTLEERTMALARDLETLLAEKEKSRTQWEQERLSLLSRQEEEKEIRQRESRQYRQIEERAATLSRELETLRSGLERERAGWEEERSLLRAELKRVQTEQALPAERAVASTASVPSVFATHEDVERLLSEIDSLLEENALLNDELRFLQEGRGPS